jgi:cysteine synthase
LFEHISEYLARPAVVRIGPGLVCIRFESMKVASARGAIAELERQGKIKPGDTLVDSSSGIYAHALALVCAARGYHCHIIASKTVDETLRIQLLALGATIDQVPSQDSLALDQSERVKRIARYLEENPSAHWMRQYHDSIHYLGYQAIADTLAADLGDTPVTLVGGVGSGASTAGLTRRLRSLSYDVRLVGIQPFGSVSFGSEHVADPEIIIAGIGSAIEFKNVDYRAYDEIHWVSFETARRGAVSLLRRSGIFAGLSAGAAYLVADHIRTSSPVGGDAGEDAGEVVFIAADTGHRYAQQVFAGAIASDAVAPSPVAPAEINELTQMYRPWSYMNWRRRDYVVGSRR